MPAPPRPPQPLKPKQPVQTIQAKPSWPNPSTFKIVKESFKCLSCKHHYIHGYRSGRTILCGGCFIKIGGQTNNTRGNAATFSGTGRIAKEKSLDD